MPHAAGVTLPAGHVHTGVVGFRSYGSRVCFIAFPQMVEAVCLQCFFSATERTFFQVRNAIPELYFNHPLLLYYRRDVFEHGLPQQGLPGGTLIPQTWDELLALAQRLNGTMDSNGDGKKDYALCLDSVQSQCGGG